MTMTATRPVRVLIADDQTLFRTGLAHLLGEDPRVEIVGQAGDGVEATKLAATLKPDVVLMDLKMPNMDGIEATRQIVEADPSIKVMLLSTFDAGLAPGVGDVPVPVVVGAHALRSSPAMAAAMTGHRTLRANMNLSLQRKS